MIEHTLSVYQGTYKFRITEEGSQLVGWSEPEES